MLAAPTLKKYGSWNFDQKKSTVMKIHLLFTILLFFFSGIFFACKKDKPVRGNDVSNQLPVIEAVKPPIAYAGPDQYIYFPADSATLDGSLSVDPDGTIQQWKWSKVAGPSIAIIVDETSAKTVVRNLVPGAYLFKLEVTDNDKLVGNDMVHVEVLPDTTHLVFTNLPWNHWRSPNDPDGVFDEIYLWINDPDNSIPDHITPNFMVWVKRDADIDNWELASNIIINGNCTAPFWFSLEPTRLLISLCYPWDMGLIGKKAEVKIRF
jgi:hypothetical protein